MIKGLDRWCTATRTSVIGFIFHFLENARCSTAQLMSLYISASQVLLLKSMALRPLRSSKLLVKVAARKEIPSKFPEELLHAPSRQQIPRSQQILLSYNFL
jgi:hypothetical protein